MCVVTVSVLFKESITDLQEVSDKVIVAASFSSVI